MIKLLSALRGDRRGVSQLEYALLGFCMIGVVLAMMGMIGDTLTLAFGQISSHFSAATGGT